MYRISKQIHNQIIKSEKILLVPHKDPDGDALGSLTAFWQFLASISKKTSAFCATEIPDNLKLLPYVDQIITDHTIWENADFDLIIVFDSGDLKRTGIDKHVENMPEKPCIINFDHHSTNEFYADLNMVILNGSSTTEVLYNFFKHNNINIDSGVATSLLAGFISDTDFFTNSATSIQSLDIASKLVICGGNTKLIKKIMFKNKTIDALKLWGLVLSRLKKHEDIDIVYTYLTRKDLEKHNVPEAMSDGISNFMNNINEGKASLIFKEVPDNKIKGSFRTTHENVDVGEISKQLGGGGHKKAAGFTVDGPLKRAAKEVFEVIKKSGQLNT